MSSAVHDICSLLTEQLSALHGIQQLDSSSAAVLGQLQVVLHLVTSPFFRPAVVDGMLVRTMADFLLALPAEGAALQDASISESRNTLLHVLEALSQVSGSHCLDCLAQEKGCYVKFQLSIEANDRQRGTFILSLQQL